MSVSAHADFPIMLPLSPGLPNPTDYVGDTRQARHDDTGTRVCATCGGPATYHLFRPSCLYRCASCVETWGTVPTITTCTRGDDGTPVVTVTLSDGPLIPHPAAPTA